MGPERSEVQPRPRREPRHTDPVGVDDPLDVVGPEHGADHAAADHADHRPPRPRQPARAQGQDHHRRQRHAGRQRRRRGSCAGGCLREQVEDDRRQGDRDQHDDRGRHRRREDTPQARQAPRDPEQRQCRQQHQGRQQRRAAFGQSDDGYGDVGRRRSHHQQMAGADPAAARGLQHGGQAAHDQAREYRPRQVGILETGAAHHDQHRHHHAGQRQRRELDRQPPGHQRPRRLVRLVADVLLKGAVLTHGAPTTVTKCPRRDAVGCTESRDFRPDTFFGSEQNLDARRGCMHAYRPPSTEFSPRFTPYLTSFLWTVARLMPSARAALVTLWFASSSALAMAWRST